MSLSIGERLKSARKSKGATLEEASKATKVQRRILEALEEDRVDDVLDTAYAKIFMKKYAGWLGLDPAQLVKEYLSANGPAPERPIAIQTEVMQARKASYRQVLMPALLGLTALIGLSFIGYLALDLYGSVMRRPGLPPPVRQAAKAPKASARPAAKAGPSVEKAPDAPKWIIPKTQPLKLTIRAKSDVWMQVKSDGAVIFQNVLPRGVSETWIAKEELELWTGNASAMDLSLNGKPLGSPGSGVKKGIRVTREGLKF